MRQRFLCLKVQYRGLFHKRATSNFLHLNLLRSDRNSYYTGMQIGDVEGYLSTDRAHVIIVNDHENDFVSLQPFSRYSSYVRI
jgi:hypothetical protein